jgi:hypothetical protein
MTNSADRTWEKWRQEAKRIKCDARQNPCEQDGEMNPRLPQPRREIERRKQEPAKADVTGCNENPIFKREHVQTAIDGPDSDCYASLV